MKDLLKEFIEAREKLIKAINKFPSNKRNEILFGTWNLKDVVAHFCAWDIFFTNTIKQLKNNKPVPYWDNINNFNEKEVSKRESLSWELVYSEFINAGKDFVDEYSNIPKELENKIIWNNKKYTPKKLLEVNIHHYQKAQLKEILKLLKKWNIRV
jgi:uncharacterized damage-inducible protein DinB